MTIRFHNGTEMSNIIPFLDSLVSQKGLTLTTSVHKKQTHWPLPQLLFRSSTARKERIYSQPT